MKQYLGSLVTAVAISVLAVVPFANARPAGMSPGGAPHGHGGGFGSWRGSGGHGNWNHGRFHDHFGFFFWGGPLWYPYYWPPYSYYDYRYDYSDPYYGYYNYNPPAYYYRGGAPDYREYDGRDYLTLGHDSGKALRLKTVSRDWLVEYLRAYIINAPPSVRDDFRRGFISGYGEDAEAVLKKAAEEANQPNAVKTQQATPASEPSLPSSGSDRKDAP